MTIAALVIGFVVGAVVFRQMRHIEPELHYRVHMLLVTIGEQFIPAMIAVAKSAHAAAIAIAEFQAVAMGDGTGTTTPRGNGNDQRNSNGTGIRGRTAGSGTHRRP
jgi:hypothetical protein